MSVWVQKNELKKLIQPNSYSLDFRVGLVRVVRLSFECTLLDTTESEGEDICFDVVRLSVECTPLDTTTKVQL